MVRVVCRELTFSLLNKRHCDSKIFVVFIIECCVCRVASAERDIYMCIYCCAHIYSLYYYFPLFRTPIETIECGKLNEQLYTLVDNILLFTDFVVVVSSDRR